MKVRLLIMGFAASGIAHAADKTPCVIAFRDTALSETANVRVRTNNLPAAITEILREASARGVVVSLLSEEATPPADEFRHRTAPKSTQGHAYAVFSSGRTIVDTQAQPTEGFTGQCAVSDAGSPFQKAFEESWRTAAAPVTASTSTPKYKTQINFDGYFAHRFGAAAPIAAVPAPTVLQRYYDAYDSEFVLNSAEFYGAVDSGGFRAAFAVGIGTWFEMNAEKDDISRYLSEGHVAYNLGPVEVEIGKFFTHVGLETARAKDNLNYSRSYLYGYAMPFWHTGVRATTTRGQWSALVALYNGTKGALFDNNRAKTFGYLLKWTPRPSVALAFGGLVGNESNVLGAATRNTYNLNGTFTLAPRTTLGFDTVWTTEGGTAWYGIEALASIPVTARYSFRPRLEWFRDVSGGAIGNGPQTVWSATLTGAYEPLDAPMEVRLELRWDWSDRAVFQNRSEQGTLSLSGLYRL